MKIINLSRFANAMVVGTLILGLTTSLWGDDGKENEDAKEEWGPLSEGCNLSIQVEKNKFNYCQPIILKITLKNSDKTPLMFADTGPESDFSIIVKNDEGKIVPLTAYGKKRSDTTFPKIIYMNVQITLQFKEKREYFLLVNRMHDMSLKGTYSITVKRSGFMREGKRLGEVVSNTIKVEVRGDPPNPFKESEDE